MGIRVVCPNGHRLNLKASLAGHRGLCPECGARFRIPFESSDIPQVRDERTKPSSPSTDPGADADSDRPAASKDGPNQPADQSPTGPHSGAPVQSSMDEARHAEQSEYGTFGVAGTWYLQVPDGDRYGPADSQTMQAWIVEGRVQPHYLVWRDGWSEWQSASTILKPQERESSEFGEFEAGHSMGSQNRVDQLGRRSSQKNATWIIFLTLIGLVLLGGIALAFMAGQLG